MRLRRTGRLRLLGHRRGSSGAPRWPTGPRGERRRCKRLLRCRLAILSDGGSEAQQGRALPSVEPHVCQQRLSSRVAAVRDAAFAGADRSPQPLGEEHSLPRPLGEGRGAGLASVLPAPPLVPARGALRYGEAAEGVLPLEGLATTCLLLRALRCLPPMAQHRHELPRPEEPQRASPCARRGGRVLGSEDELSVRGHDAHPLATLEQERHLCRDHVVR
mmetsp:Transcript_23642/g.69882  ORF Transcript_23642/g.69882 Transcript_23642/m.69882 type:complete len:218 (+) Transcript_23642:128-781(+)